MESYKSDSCSYSNRQLYVLAQYFAGTSSKHASGESKLHCYIIRHFILITCMSNHATIGVRAGGARGAAAPPNFGQLRFFGQQEKIWAKPAFKDVSMFFY